ncbi:MAG: bifunctional DNA-formamidopyrimidine glycosylase/DNA-(apurinic or apyrimidinic site) lyase [Patescibacteria group bacterium]|nr:bifunctional DNA-formamidopyrimidine glycosylase/DNA-(apurinic or apyrimidinic site) lyase [Patescibacteria group bacterium]MDD4610481.1 bifunctional DNA-formamidopyrimidine glycosylase/DNA-(apurinic or apyrimidinic site) lyase [Patescibacteria group bacterium]
MPELPEVETIRNDLKRKILDEKIEKIEILSEKSLRGNIESFKKLLEGNFFSDIKRIGKLMIFEIGRGDKFMLVHLKMTGQLIYQDKKIIVAGGHSSRSDEGAIKNLPDKFTRVIFYFKNGEKLFFNDLRRFGNIQIVDKKELKKIKNKFGIEPLTKNFTLENLKKVIDGRKLKIKSVLMNQQIISGIGNIYADEILFAAGVLPDRIACRLSAEEIKKIFCLTEKIIKKAIKYRGTTFSNYVDTSGRRGGFSKMLKVYGRAGEKCVCCQEKIKKIKLGGRGTHFCEYCQH